MAARIGIVLALSLVAVAALVLTRNSTALSDCEHAMWGASAG